MAVIGSHSLARNKCRTSRGEEEEEEEEEAVRVLRLLRMAWHE